MRRKSQQRAFVRGGLRAEVHVLLRGAAAAAFIVGVLIVGSGCGGQRRSASSASCNEAAGLCSRRLDEVFFAGTHNSFAAAKQPGWYFASQTDPISQQLQDGIRALLIDIHFGVKDPASGQVRTDLTAEGSDRNKVAEQVPAQALRIADGVAGGVGLGTLHGTPEPYLCHTLCELGAEPLDRELAVIRSFLEHHPDQVVIVIVEDYVPPATIEKAFRSAGLTRYVATLKRHAPLPTLGELTAAGHRLVVFAEEQGGVPAWYMPAFAFIQDTPLGALQPGQLSCDRYRGEQSSPMLLINHWIPPFPPSRTLNAEIGRAAFLRRRIERCTDERGIGGAIVAVDFYERTRVVEVTRRLNQEKGDKQG